MVDETMKLGRGVLFALDNGGQITIHSTERACPKCGRSFQPLDPKIFSYNSSQGWCPTCRGFGELFYLPDVDRGARADAIEESWFDWQEGNREICPECQGTRLNPVARAVRLHVPLRRKLYGWLGARAEVGRALRCAPMLPRNSPNTARSGVRALPPRVCSVPTIDFFANLAVESACELFDQIHFKGREALIARDILPEIRE